MKRSFALLALAGAALSLTHAASAQAFGEIHDYVYVETNIKTPNGNSIAGFVRGANGQVQPIPGSPFLTGGAGRG